MAMLCGQAIFLWWRRRLCQRRKGGWFGLPHVAPGEAARQLAEATGREPAMAQLILDESSEILRATPAAIIARQNSGHVLANAGIDASNVEGGDDGSCCSGRATPTPAPARSGPNWQN